MDRKNRLWEFTGSLLWKDTVVLDFEVAKGRVQKWRLHEENRKWFPFEFGYNPTLDGLNYFIESRIVPPTRQNLQQVLKDLRIDEYDWSEIIKANYGLCTDDCYWFRQAGSELVYDDIKIRD